ncbi:MAG: hypothetical protein M1819_000830 [Sarea resinae]|nr:MAG: hypothetical protein M1819_000830 [Sarea resinae]
MSESMEPPQGNQISACAKDDMADIYDRRLRLSLRKGNTRNLLRSLVVIRDSIVLNIPFAPKKYTELALRAILEEASRLDNEPGCFKDEQSKAKFFSAMCRYCEQITRASSIWKQHERREQAIIKGLIVFLATISRLSFDPNRHSWNQFLCKNGPGTGVKFKHDNPTAWVQVLPRAGISIMASWDGESKKVRNAIQSRTKENLMVNLKKTYTPDFLGGPPTVNITAVMRLATIQPNPFPQVDANTIIILKKMLKSNVAFSNHDKRAQTGKT